MPRPPRIQFEGATYHVFSRGNRRERLFWDEKDYGMFERIMLEATRWSGVQLFNWGLMPNHFHFNLETPDGNLSEFMQRVQSRFAKYFNWAHQLVGHVFQGRYGARLVDHESYFQEIVRYVELNPYRLKKGLLAKLGEWKWSSWRYYRMPESEWPEGCHQAFRKVLERFGPDTQSARQVMAAFLADGLRTGTWEDFYRVKDNRFVGSESFIEHAKRANGEEVRSTQRLILPRLDTADFMHCAQSASGLSLTELSSPDQSRTRGRWRYAIATVARRFYQMSMTEIGRLLGRDSTTVSHLLQKRNSSIEETDEVKQLLQALRRYEGGAQ